MQDITPKYNIICLSNQLWDFPNWTNKKHVMTRLAKQGHNVLFVDPPINAGRVFARQIQRGYWPLGRLLTAKKYDQTGALVYTPINFSPVDQVTSKSHAKKLVRMAKRFFNPEQKTLLWIYHVEIKGLENYLKILPHDILIYDCVDNYESFPGYDTEEKKDWIRGQEKYLARKADLVFASAPGLLEKLKTYNQNVFFTPNVGDYEKFKVTQNLKDKIPPDLKDIPRPRVGFAGALDKYKFDPVLMEKIAKDHPNYSFVLIGQFALKDTEAGVEKVGLSSQKNIYLLGTKPYETLENYYAGFDAYIIPYQLNDYTVGGCFPVKFHDALAAGLATVVTDLPAYAPFKDACYISANYDEFSKNIKKALEEDNEKKIEQRQVVAKENSWEGKIDKMLKLISDALV